MPTTIDVGAVAQEIASDLDALRLYDREMQEEPWKRSNQAYIDLVEERFTALTDKINEIYSDETSVPARLRDTISAMLCVSSIWNAWVEREQVTLPREDRSEAFHWLIVWLDATDVDG